MAEYVTRISSLNNARVKDIVRLNNRRQRDSKRLTIVEGQREVERALQAGVVPKEAYICPELISIDSHAGDTLQKLAQAGATQLFEVTSAVFDKIAYRGSSGGVLLVIPYLNYSFEQLSELKSPFLVVVDAAEKPGNLGAILRTADAAGVDALILTNEEGTGTDIHNPNAIRASLGAIFTVPVLSTTVNEAAAWLHKRRIHIVAAAPDADEIYTSVSLTGPTAVVLGSEAFGLSNNWIKSADMLVQIPMFGVVDSLNLSVSAALLLYEVVRQRANDVALSTANS